ncbi:c-type cytochrome domain-containing protein [Prosthecobacter sp.]|jgi:mono/diheme cytochrome c family protein|uniref:c-type cytochrome domain-containing protein n=1 Tax=Prosthecobacter sp. TaxID=1965333 RepID=UPI0025DAD45C|nr:c-type cytochrome domain-containing protein [Prosthecobacter sp.]
MRCHPMKYRTLLALAFTVGTASAVDYKTQVAPIFRQKCFACHSVTQKVKGKVALDDAKLPEQIGAGKNIIPGEAMKSTMFINCTLPDDDADVMPPDGKNRLTAAELDVLKAWITEGASLTAGGAAPAPAPAAATTVGAPGDGPLMKWTNTEGKTIEAHFMGLDGGGVLLKIPSTGVTHIFPLDKLSAESQTQAKSATK